MVGRVASLDAVSFAPRRRMVGRSPAVVVLRTLVHAMLVREVTPERRWLLRELGKNEGACHDERRLDESHVVCLLLCLFVRL